MDNAKYDSEDMDLMRRDESIIHFCQSHYATEFLQTNHIPMDRIRYLSDYINTAFLVKKKTETRDDVVLFNPRKGFDTTALLIKYSSAKIKWRALSGLTPEGMREVMEHAKIYVDFGNHPGKDRIPREAALSGCMVLTNRRGSAQNNIDVPIDDKYKFGDGAEISHILGMIYYMLDHYYEEIGNYKTYIDKIKREFQEFEKDIVKLFEEITGKTSVVEAKDKIQHMQDIQKEIQVENYTVALREFVQYKMRYPEETIETDIIEANIRIGIGELCEAEYCVIRGLEKDDKNYELYLLLAQIYTILGREERDISKYCLKAMKYSLGTPDESYVAEVCKGIFLGNQEGHFRNSITE